MNAFGNESNHFSVDILPSLFNTDAAFIDSFKHKVDCKHIVYSEYASGTTKSK